MTDTSHPTVRRERSPRGRGAVLRDELVQAAAALLDRTGDPDGVTIRGVAAEVGVAPTAIYLHFADRDELMVTVVEERFAEFHRTIDEADPGGDPLEALVARGEATSGSPSPIPATTGRCSAFSCPPSGPTWRPAARPPAPPPSRR